MNPVRVFGRWASLPIVIAGKLLAIIVAEARAEDLKTAVKNFTTAFAPLAWTEKVDAVQALGGKAPFRDCAGASCKWIAEAPLKAPLGAVQVMRITKTNATLWCLIDANYVWRVCRDERTGQVHTYRLDQDRVWR